MKDTLLLASGFFWMATYIMLIRRDFLDRTYGMPLAALSANIAWEFIFTFLYPQHHPQLYVNFVWFILDAIIVFQFWKFGRRELDFLPDGWFIPMGILALVTGFLAVLLISLQFDDFDGAYAAFGQNLMMSILFVVMAFRRSDLRGQSLYIAIAKMLGTAFASLAFVLFPHHFRGPLPIFLYLGILVYDWLYILVVYQKSRALGLNPWKRW